MYYCRKEKWGYILEDYSSDRIWGIGEDALGDKDIEDYVLDLCSRELPYRENGWFYRGSIKEKFELSAPISISWNLTDRCNSKCIFCCNDATSNGNYGIDTDRIFAVIDAMKKWGVMRIIFGGGEPSLRKDLVDILHYSKNAGIRPAIATNGILLDDVLIEEIRETCCTLQISLDTLNRSRYNYLRGVDALPKVIKNLKSAVNMGAPVRIVTVVNEENFGDLNDVAEFIAQLGIKQWFIFDVLKAGRAKTKEFDFFIDKNVLKDKIQHLFDQYPQIEIFMWGSGENDQISIYVESSGTIVVRNYGAGKFIELSKDGFSELVNTWNALNDNLKTKSFLNFIQPNMANPNNMVD